MQQADVGIDPHFGSFSVPLYLIHDTSSHLDIIGALFVVDQHHSSAASTLCFSRIYL